MWRVTDGSGGEMRDGLRGDTGMAGGTQGDRHGTTQSTSRRGFLGGAVGGALALGGAAAPGSGVVTAPEAAAVPRRTTGKGRRAARRVAVLGGGVAGLTAAHELAERGFQVTVHERKPHGLGGKARSMDVPNSAHGGRKPLPGEHGFRFIPGIYHNLPDTLRRIPFPGNANGCHDNLVASTEVMLARTGGRENIRFPFSSIGTPPPVLTPDAFLRLLTGQLETFTRLPAHEIAYFANRMLVFFTSCEQRRLDVWEHTPWWRYLRADDMSADYQQLLAIGMTRNIVATKAEIASTRTVATCGEAFIFNLLGRGADGEPDRVLNLPTNEAWIDPWVACLRSLGVEFKVGWSVRDLTLAGGRITEAVVTDPQGARHAVTADHFVQAMPVEHARATWNASVRAADPQLVRCDRLETDWMTGLQFYLTEPTPILHGHINHIDTPWALTAVAQAQYWKDRDFPADYGDGTAADCLSVDISEWNRPGLLYGKTAKQCTREEVAREVWAQMKAGLNDTGAAVLRDATVHSWFLDPAVDGLGTPHPANDEQLLIHPTGTWFNRPSSRTAIPNLFLAGDYVTVDIDLATMEGANASARQAVNALLDEDGSSAARCEVQRLYRAPEFEPLKADDARRHRLGLRNAFDLG
ncbi:FAD-dependent oxidoreductase [Streptomyces halobius]|uniref:FAD-dependent oxidoreductase n=2 Tax=Streptomyces halobius TaxID=2879846 RepID=A0ABY4M365_9ACTN|nr:FAD-dependent oxidoreductase [Streptomyces halobius]UQA92211.1 FAD-dependent oxidoreductase [Streptomyces halobius]